VVHTGRDQRPDDGRCPRDSQYPDSNQDGHDVVTTCRGIDRILEHGLTEHTGAARAELASEVFTYLHLPIVGGVILAALGLEQAMVVMGVPAGLTKDVAQAIRAPSSVVLVRGRAPASASSRGSGLGATDSVDADGGDGVAVDRGRGESVSGGRPGKHLREGDPEGDRTQGIFPDRGEDLMG
jgi:hypothetical protein